MEKVNSDKLTGLSKVVKRSFTSCFDPHYEIHAKCKVFIVKICMKTKLIFM